MKKLLIVLLALWRAPSPITAGPSDPEASLAALLREAGDKHPTLRAGRARLEASRLAPSQAGSLPDPEVSIAYTNDGVSSFSLGESDMSVLALTWTQEAPYPGKRARRQEAASFAAERFAEEFGRLRLEVATGVKSAYAELYRLDRTTSILEESRAVLASLVEVALRRYEVGQGVQENVLKAQTEILRLDAEQVRVAEDRRVAEVRLNAAVGRLQDVPIGRVADLPPAEIPAEGEQLADSALAGSPELRGMQAEIRREEAGVSLAQLEQKPDFVWSASYQNRDGMDPLVMAMFGARLPLFRDRNQAQALLQKQADLEAARGDLADLQARIQAACREQIARARRADRLLRLFQEEVIPQADSTFESAQSSYRVGRIGFLEVLNDLKVLLEARIELAIQEAERLRAIAALELLLGRELVHVPEDPGRGGGRDGIR